MSRKSGQEGVDKVQGKMAATRNLGGIVKRRGYIGEQFGHVGGTAQVLMLAIEMWPIGIRERPARMNTNTRLVRIEIVSAYEPDVVAGNDTNSTPACQLQARLYTIFLSTAPGTNQFEVITITEHRLPSTQQLTGLILVPKDQGFADIAVDTAGQCQ